MEGMEKRELELFFKEQKLRDEGLTEDQIKRVMTTDEELKVENSIMYNSYATKGFLLSLTYTGGTIALLILAAIWYL